LDLLHRATYPAYAAIAEPCPPALRPSAPHPAGENGSDLDRADVAWAALTNALQALQDCRKIDAFHALSVHRIATVLLALSMAFPDAPTTAAAVMAGAAPPALPLQAMLPVPQPDGAAEANALAAAEAAAAAAANQAAAERPPLPLAALGLAPTPAAALVETLKLFDRKRPQIVAIWSI